MKHSYKDDISYHSLNGISITTKFRWLVQIRQHFLPIIYEGFHLLTIPTTITITGCKVLRRYKSFYFRNKKRRHYLYLLLIQYSPTPKFFSSAVPVLSLDTFFFLYFLFWYISIHSDTFLIHLTRFLSTSDNLPFLGTWKKHRLGSKSFSDSIKNPILLYIRYCIHSFLLYTIKWSDSQFLTIGTC